MTCYSLLMFLLTALVACQGEQPRDALSGPVESAASDWTNVDDRESQPELAETPDLVAQEEVREQVEESPETRNPEIDRAVGRLIEEYEFTRKPDLSVLLDRPDVREITGYTGSLSVSTIGGQLTNRSHNSQRIATESSYGVGLQVWYHESSQDASRMYTRLSSTYIGVNEAGRGQIGDRAFRSDFGGIQQLVFYSDQHQAVVAISCSEDLCDGNTSLSQLAQRVLSRL